MDIDDAREPCVGLALRPRFSASVRSSVLHLSGELDLESAPALRAALDQVTRAGGTITLDLGGVTFMDASGVDLLVVAQLVAERESIVVLRASPKARRVLELCDVGDLFELR